LICGISSYKVRYFLYRHIFLFYIVFWIVHRNKDLIKSLTFFREITPHSCYFNIFRDLIIYLRDLIKSPFLSSPCDIYFCQQKAINEGIVQSLNLPLLQLPLFMAFWESIVNLPCIYTVQLYLRFNHIFTEKTQSHFIIDTECVFLAVNTTLFIFKQNQSNIIAFTLALFRICYMRHFLKYVAC
jgi:hypothetical protein